MRDRRLALGFTQVELGDRIGRSSMTISRWENGQRPVGDARLIDSVLRMLELAATIDRSAV